MLGFLVAFTLQEPNTHQFFNDTGTGRRCSQTFALHLIGHFVRTGSFHALQERIFGVVLRRRSFTFLDFCSADSHFITNGNRRKCLFLFVDFCRIVFLDIGFPTIMQNGFTLCGERCAAAIQFNDCLCVSVRISDSHTQAGGNELQNCKLSLGKFPQIAFLQFSGRDDGMVVCDLFVIHNLLCMDRNIIHTLHGECVESQIYDVRQAVCYIVSQESAVGTGISDQFLFIEILRVVQSLLCRVAKHTVCISLQTGEVIERRRFFGFIFAFCLCDGRHRTAFADCFSFSLFLVALT